MSAPPTPSSEDAPRHPRTFSRRRFLAGSAAVPLSLVLGDKLAAWAATPPKGYGPQGACGLPPYILNRIWRGYDPKLSGQIIVVPHGRNFLGAGAPHASPWPYTQDVPMFFYGPGVVKPGTFTRPVTSADIAPTLARIVDFEDGFPGPGGQPIDGADMTELQLLKKPALVVVMVWDAGGRYVLDLWPKNWPHLRAMKPHGAWFENATVGSSPSNTAPIHATIGTGCFPRNHGIIDNVMKFPDGRIRSSWADGPDAMKRPAMAELYQAAMGNDVVIGMAGSVSWHLGMVGHGNTATDAPKPVVILKNDTDGGDSAPQWEMPPSVDGYYRFADYVRDLPPLDDPNGLYFQYADTINDGADDGKWQGYDIGSLEGGWATPARIPYQTNAIKSLVQHEGFGDHSPNADLLFVNYKLIDEIGHRYYASSPEMADCVTAQDHYLALFTRFLDNQVGQGRWMMLVTADHGHTAAPGVSGGYLINQHEVQNRIEALRASSSDPALLTQVRPMWLNVNDTEREHSGLTYEDISKLIASLTKSDTASIGDDPFATLSTEPVFDAAFAGSLLEHLPCWHPPA